MADDTGTGDNMNEDVELRYVAGTVDADMIVVWFEVNNEALQWLAAEGVTPHWTDARGWFGLNGDSSALTRLFDATRDRVLDYVRDEVDRAVRDAETVAV